jgi:hypothetical protein
MRRPFAVIAGFALAVTLAGPVGAVDEPMFPAGTACEGFGLNVYVGDGGPQNVHEFADGTVLSAGRGNALTFENADTGATFETRATGAVSRGTPNADGTTTWTLTGANVLIMFPSDKPAGPSTTLYIGRLIYSADASSNFTFRSSTGRSVDICEALS